MAGVLVETTFRSSPPEAFLRSVGHDQEPSTIVTVKVPVRTPIVLSENTGDVRVGDTHGELTVAVTGSGDVAAGEVASAYVSIGGSGDVDIDKVHGKADIRIGGSGDVDIDTVIGSVNIESRASGAITVKHVLNPPLQKATGSGDIRVKRVG